MTSAAFTLDELRAQAAQIIGTELRDVLIGGAGDIQAAVNETTELMVRALAEGRMDLVNEIRGQFRMIAERNRVRAASSGWRIASKVLAVLAGFFLTIASKGLIEGVALIDDLEEGLGGIDVDTTSPDPFPG